MFRSIFTLDRPLILKSIPEQILMLELDHRVLTKIHRNLDLLPFDRLESVLVEEQNEWVIQHLEQIRRVQGKNLLGQD